ncbi:hypothetical protein F5B20DRAFT_562964 [Whalleya microplaca]|nr:hypothetical protein F5B20DRAFT_562964 [Whalleya microplaca]
MTHRSRPSSDIELECMSLLEVCSLTQSQPMLLTASITFWAGRICCGPATRNSSPAFIFSRLRDPQPRSCSPAVYDPRREHSRTVVDLPSQDMIAWQLEQGFQLEGEPYWTLLIRACDQYAPESIRVLLALGANPNGLGPVSVRTRYRREQLSRPIDFLLEESFADHWWRFKEDGMELLVKSAKLLIDHGATTAPARFAGDPVRTMLDRIWKTLCPLGRRAGNLGFEKYDDVTVEDILDGLSDIDISPFDELCDIVADASPIYRDRTPGLRGKDRLFELLRQRGHKLQLWWRWFPFF